MHAAQRKREPADGAPTLLELLKLGSLSETAATPPLQKARACRWNVSALERLALLGQPP
jgi:hypothetical protein